MTGTEWAQLALAIAAGQTIADNIETAIMLYLRRRELARRKQWLDEVGRSMAAEAIIELSKIKREEEN